MRGGPCRNLHGGDWPAGKGSGGHGCGGRGGAAGKDGQCPAGLGKGLRLRVRQSQVTGGRQYGACPGKIASFESQIAVSNPESFIDEVTEEVRRDRLFALFRKYGWIGALLVIGVVGGTAYNEWSKARAAANAQAFGDALLDALDTGGTEERRAALSAITATGSQQALLQLVLASDPEQDKAATLAALTALAGDASQPQSLRDLAVLRRVIVAGSDMSVSERRAALDGISAPGRAFRTLALEQSAYLSVEEGKIAEAITALRALTTDQEAPAGLRQRAEQMIVALGGDAAGASGG